MLVAAYRRIKTSLHCDAKQRLEARASSLLAAAVSAGSRDRWRAGFRARIPRRAHRRPAVVGACAGGRARKSAGRASRLHCGRFPVHCHMQLPGFAHGLCGGGSQRRIAPTRRCCALSNWPARQRRSFPGARFSWRARLGLTARRCTMARSITATTSAPMAIWCGFIANALRCSRGRVGIPAPGSARV